MSYICYQSPKAGVARPFNFFGYYETEDMNRLADKLSNATLASNHAFLVNDKLLNIYAVYRMIKTLLGSRILHEILFFL